MQTWDGVIVLQVQDILYGLLLWTNCYSCSPVRCQKYRNENMKFLYSVCQMYSNTQLGSLGANQPQSFLAFLFFMLYKLR